jgi:hypothetical protein
MQGLYGKSQMEWTIDYLEKDNVVYVKLLNPLKLKNLKELLRQLKLKASEYNSHRIIVDQRGVEIGMSVLDLDKVPDVVKDFGGDCQHKTAILVDPFSQERTEYEFVKNVLTLRSFKVKVFSDMDKAVTWLKSD